MNAINPANRLRAALCALVLAASAAGAGAGMAADLVGKPVVVDGDTIDLAGHRLRLAGIDAPEAGQTCRRGDGTVYSCGQMATFALAGIIETQWVTCRAVPAPREQAGPREEEAQRRRGMQAVCRIGPYDVGAEMVRRGWAVAAPGNGGAYAAEQDAARAAGAGLWQGAFDTP